MAWNQPQKMFLWLDTTASDTLFEGHKWGWYGIDNRAVVSQNQNDPSFKNVWSPQSLSYINIFLHCLPLKWMIIVLLPSASIDMKEVDIAQLTYGYILRYLGIWILMYTCSVW